MADFLLASIDELRPTPRCLSTQVSDGFEQLCANALVRMPRDRFKNADEMLKAMDAILTTATVPIGLDAAPGAPATVPIAPSAAADTAAFASEHGLQLAEDVASTAPHPPLATATPTPQPASAPTLEAVAQTIPTAPLPRPPHSDGRATASTTSHLTRNALIAFLAAAVVGLVIYIFVSGEKSDPALQPTSSEAAHDATSPNVKAPTSVGARYVAAASTTASQSTSSPSVSTTGLPAAIPTSLPTRTAHSYQPVKPRPKTAPKPPPRPTPKTPPPRPAYDDIYE